MKKGLQQCCRKNGRMKADFFMNKRNKINGKIHINLRIVFYFKNKSAKYYFINVPCIFISFIYFTLLLFDDWNLKIKLKSCERKENKGYFR